MFAVSLIRLGTLKPFEFGSSPTTVGHGDQIGRVQIVSNRGESLTA